MEPWRDILPQEAEPLGLVPIPPEALHVGKQVVIIPPSFTYSPSALVATLVDRTPTVAKHSTLCARYPDQEEEVVEWSAVANRMRGIPLLTVVHCYEVPTAEPLEVVAARIDEFFRNLPPLTTTEEGESGETPTNQKTSVKAFLDE